MPNNWISLDHLIPTFHTAVGDFQIGFQVVWTGLGGSELTGGHNDLTYRGTRTPANKKKTRACQN